MKPANLMRSTAGVTLSAVAKALSAGSRATERVAGLVRPEPPPSDRRSRRPSGPGPRMRPAPEARRDGPAVGDGNGRETTAAEPPGASLDIASRGAVREPPTEPTDEGPAHVRTHETHIEGLAAKTAAEVVEAIPDLSTDELGRLYEHETANKKRKTVLSAVERAADPRAESGAGEEPMPEAGGVPTGGAARR